MPVRGPLDLTKILSQYDLDGVMREPKGPPPVPESKDRRYFSDRPYQLGGGPAEWSTCMALVPFELTVHDVNGYYRELGVHHKATRRELMDAYVARDGQSSPRLTYVFKQLLNPKTRDAYDRMPQGETFLDEYTVDELRRRASAESSRLARQGEIKNVEQVLDSWGYEVLEDDLDNVKALGKDSTQSKQRDPWGYSYYGYRTAQGWVNDELPRAWQEHLSRAAARKGVSPRIAIGLVGLSDHPFMMMEVGGKPVVFFPEGEEPSDSIADDVIESFQSSPSNSP